LMVVFLERNGLENERKCHCNVLSVWNILLVSDRKL
jgi:hypothetical protein